MNADGEAFRVITQGEAKDGDGLSEVYVIGADGSNMITLTKASK